MAEGERGIRPRMFSETGTDDGLTTWQRFERIAAKVFSVRKADIEPHKPIQKKIAPKKESAKS